MFDVSVFDSTSFDYYNVYLTPLLLPIECDIIRDRQYYGNSRIVVKSNTISETPNILLTDSDGTNPDLLDYNVAPTLYEFTSWKKVRVFSVIKQTSVDQQGLLSVIVDATNITPGQYMLVITLSDDGFKYTTPSCGYIMVSVT